jgi:predicted nucleic acid-binding protein
MPIALHDLDNGYEAIGIALQLRRESAYDASYVASAEELDAGSVDARRPACS